MPNIADRLTTLPNCQAESEKLCLPSDILPAGRGIYEADKLADEEMLLREGEAHNALESVQQAVKFVT